MIDSNGSPSYRLIFSAQQVQRIYALHQEALNRSLGDVFIAALKEIERQLRTNPVQFGDPLYRLPAAKLVVYTRAIFPIAVDYGVHQEKPIVFIRSIRLMI
jgi:hypothetical protein